MSDKVLDTWLTAPKIHRTVSKESCLVHIYPTTTTLGRRYPLTQDSLILGRGEESEIRIYDHSVSRRHARIAPAGDGYLVEDLQSTNGTFVNDVQIHGIVMLNDGDFVRIGNCIYKFLSGGNLEAHYHEEIYRLMIIDALTEIHNRRYLMEFLDRELARSIRHNRPITLLLIDIDHFKTINDRNGHLCGDFVLRELSHRIRDRVRREDLFARYGGEEFTLVLVETQVDDAIEVAERIRTSISELPFEFEGEQFYLTISIGISGTPGGETGLTPEELIRRVDEKLYLAKNKGRDCVAV